MDKVWRQRYSCDKVSHVFWASKISVSVFRVSKFYKSEFLYIVISVEAIWSVHSRILSGWHCSHMNFFLSKSDLFYLVMVGLVGYCYTWSNSNTHTHTLGRNPLGEGSARGRDLYLAKHNNHNRQTSMLPAGFKTKIPASWRLQIYALDRATTVIGSHTTRYITFLRWPRIRLY